VGDLHVVQDDGLRARGAQLVSGGWSVEGLRERGAFAVRSDAYLQVALGVSGAGEVGELALLDCEYRREGGTQESVKLFSP
jgi:hypothetical protein